MLVTAAWALLFVRNIGMGVTVGVEAEATLQGVTT
jgi:hypothetical protein